MSKKNNKTVYIPDWVIEILDREALNYEGPGTFAAAAIYAFSRLSIGGKKKGLKDYKAQDISISYDEKAAAGIVGRVAHDVPGQQYKTQSQDRQKPKAV